MEFTVKGKKAYAYTGGKPFDPALPTVVFCHGAQCDHSVWILQTRYLAHHGYGVLALDLPGHGRSEGPALARIVELADWVAAVLDAAGVKQANVVGHSMGALIAHRMRRAPSGAPGEDRAARDRLSNESVGRAARGDEKHGARGAGHGQHLVAPRLCAIPQQPGSRLLGDRREPAPDAAAEARRDACGFSCLRRLRRRCRCRGQGAVSLPCF